MCHPEEEREHSHRGLEAYPGGYPLATSELASPSSFKSHSLCGHSFAWVLMTCALCVWHIQVTPKT